MPPRPKRPTARPDLSERGFFSTMPSCGPRQTLSAERPVDVGALIVVRTIMAWLGEHDR